MNLEETIAGLEKQAAQYTEAARTLRELLRQEGGQTAAVAATASRPPAAAKKAAKKSGGAKKKQGAGKAAVSPETRAKISAALKASHAARKSQPA